MSAELLLHPSLCSMELVAETGAFFLAALESYMI